MKSVCWALWFLFFYKQKQGNMMDQGVNQLRGRRVAEKGVSTSFHRSGAYIIMHVFVCVCVLLVPSQPWVNEPFTVPDSNGLIQLKCPC